MSSEEKAKELVEKYYRARVLDYMAAKQCALIAVNEIINLRMAHAMGAGDNNGSVKDYYTAVKSAIEKL